MEQAVQAHNFVNTEPWSYDQYTPTQQVRHKTDCKQ